jgi:hypothetical protein
LPHQQLTPSVTPVILGRRLRISVFRREKAPVILGQRLRISVFRREKAPVILGRRLRISAFGLADQLGDRLSATFIASRRRFARDIRADCGDIDEGVERGVVLSGRGKLAGEPTSS